MKVEGWVRVTTRHVERAADRGPKKRFVEKVCCMVG